MLSRLLIENLVTVEKQTIEFGTGFNALTGETGAGKSVVLKAVKLILGEKCPKDLIRSAKNFLFVEAIFELGDDSQILNILKQLKIKREERLTIRRKVYLSGRNRVSVNGLAFNVSALPRLGKYLIDLHGQHSQQLLLQSKTHIDYFDQFAGLKKETEEFANIYGRCLKKTKLKTEMRQAVEERGEKMDFIRFQIDEIERVGFSTEEERELLNELKRLSDAEKLIELLSPAADWSSEPRSPLGIISSGLHRLRSAPEIDPGLRSVVDDLQSGLIALEEAVGDINAYLSGLTPEPRRLDEVNRRLSHMEKLKRKYGGSPAEIDKYKEQRRDELERLEALETEYEKLDEEINRLKQAMRSKAEMISGARRREIAEFESRILTILRGLGLERSRFKAALKALPLNKRREPTYCSKGVDQMEFLISPNPGAPLRPIAKIASGGEISRIMLALKTVLKEDLSFGSMIFDEIDAGISGRIADAVGTKLLELARRRQIICVTHSPQIAAKAETHLKVEKVFINNSSSTVITRLKAEERTQEIAGFLGGNKISEKTLSAAREMLNSKKTANCR